MKTASKIAKNLARMLGWHENDVAIVESALLEFGKQEQERILEFLQTRPGMCLCSGMGAESCDKCETTSVLNYLEEKLKLGDE